VSWDQITAAPGFELDDAGKPKPIPLRGITKAAISDFIVVPREEDRADPEVEELIAEVADWSPAMARLIRWLRETGMRLAEAVNLRAEDIHPGASRQRSSAG
jgi:integrase